MSKKQIRGLLDYMEALNSGEDWELAPMSETFVHGMGLGASATATRWAYKGYLSELSVEITAFKNRAGRKKLAQYDGVDCKRAYAIWWYLYQLRYPNNRSLKNRHLIEHMQRCGKYDKKVARLFPRNHGRLESSVSRGKKLLEIDENWESKVCEELILD